MTLILTIGNSQGVFQSSDFALTTPNDTVICDAGGSKQLQATIKNLHVQLAFTGIARVGGKSTIELLRQEIEKIDDDGLQSICQKLAAFSESVFKASGQFLAIVIIAAQRDGTLHIAEITNWIGGKFTDRFSECNPSSTWTSHRVGFARQPRQESARASLTG